MRQLILVLAFVSAATRIRNDNAALSKFTVGEEPVTGAQLQRMHLLIRSEVMGARKLFRRGYILGITLLAVAILFEVFGMRELASIMSRPGEGLFDTYTAMAIAPSLAYACGALGLVFVGVTYFHQLAAAVRQSESKPISTQP